MACVVRDELNRKIAILDKESNDIGQYRRELDRDPVDGKVLDAHAADNLAVAQRLRNDELRELIYVRNAHVQDCPDCNG